MRWQGWPGRRRESAHERGGLASLVQQVNSGDASHDTNDGETGAQTCQYPALAVELSILANVSEAVRKYTFGTLGISYCDGSWILGSKERLEGERLVVLIFFRHVRKRSCQDTLAIFAAPHSHAVSFF